MKELTTKQNIQEAIDSIDFDALVKQEIAERAEETIKDVVKEQFTWRGPIRNQIEEEFKKIGMIDLSRLGVLGLSGLMSDAIVEGVNELIAEETKEVTKKHLYRALDGYSKLNEINELVRSLEQDLNNREDYDSPNMSGEISIEYIEEESSYSRYTNKYWLIKAEIDVDGDFTEEEIKVYITDNHKGEIYNLKGEDLDHLQYLYDDLEKIERFRLEVNIEEEEFSFNNYDC